MTCDTPYYVTPKMGTQAVPVPCGRCPPCKLRRVNSWVFRLLQEEKVSTSSHFITLTYDTKHVPISENGFMTLSKRDFQLFMKRLRKICPNTIKYYAVGEYGTNNKRPHYHAIVFNVPDPQMYFDAWTVDGDNIGIVDVGNVSTNSIAYTMKYIDKANFKRQHGRDDREPEFPLMSKGLGASYLSEDVINYHKDDITRLYATKEGGYRVALPRYYRQKIYSESDLKAQVEIIQKVVEINEAKDKKEYNQLYRDHPAPITYEAWKENKKYGRYNNFYSQQKDRDV